MLKKRNIHLRAVRERGTPAATSATRCAAPYPAARGSEASHRVERATAAGAPRGGAPHRRAGVCGAHRMHRGCVLALPSVGVHRRPLLCFRSRQRFSAVYKCPCAPIAVTQAPSIDKASRCWRDTSVPRWSASSCLPSLNCSPSAHGLLRLAAWLAWSRATRPPGSPNKPTVGKVHAQLLARMYCCRGCHQRAETPAIKAPPEHECLASTCGRARKLTGHAHAFEGGGRLFLCVVPSAALAASSFAPRRLPTAATRARPLVPCAPAKSPHGYCERWWPTWPRPAPAATASESDVVPALMHGRARWQASFSALRAAQQPALLRDSRRLTARSQCAQHVSESQRAAHHQPGTPV